MSIVIYNQPSSLEPVYSPFYFKVGGFGTSTFLNFRYVYDLYVKDTSATTYTFIHREKQFPQLDGYGIYSPARILENYVSYNIQNLFNTGFSQSIQSVKHYQVKFLEEWTTTASTYTFTSTTNAGGYVQYNYQYNNNYIVGDRIKIDKANKAYNSQYDGVQTILTANTLSIITDKAYGDVVSNESGTTTYRLTITSAVTFSGTVINFARQFTERTIDIPTIYNMGSNVGQPLTNHTLAGSLIFSLKGYEIPSSIFLKSNEYYQISWVANSGWYPTHTLVYTWGHNGNLKSMYRVANNLSSIRYDFGIGPANLAIQESDLLNVTTNYIYDSTVRTIVAVPVIYSGGTYYPGGDKICVQIIDDCSRYHQYRLAFLNRLGGIDIFRFSRKSVRKINIEREMFVKPLSWNYNITDRGETSLNVNYQEEITANSNWLTEKEAEIMEELFCSTEVWNVDDDNQLVQPVVVTSKEYTTKTIANNKLIQYTITFRFAYKNNLQRN